MSTPETDKELRAWRRAKSYPTDAVPADFARDIERKLAQCRDALKQISETVTYGASLARKALAATEPKP